MTATPFLVRGAVYSKPHTRFDSIIFVPTIIANHIMAAFFRRITGSPGNNTSPPVHDDDVVYPLHMLDDSKTLRSIVVAWTLRFDEVLDVEKLYDSLSRLLEIDDWRMIGGRLRLRVILLHTCYSESGN